VRGTVVVARRRATGADIPLLRDLFADARVELAVLPPDTRFVLVDMRFRAQRRQHSAQYPDARHEILVVNGVEVGRLVVDSHDGDVHIVDITVGLGRRREGIASAVLRDLVDESVATGQRVWLTIWSGNTAMRSLCEQLGFEVTAHGEGELTLSRAAQLS
jgi:ribosomal protein S18 acetylase RimI-like enzyme